MNKKKFIVFVPIFIAILVVTWNQTSETVPTPKSFITSTFTFSNPTSIFDISRVTKKPFGLYATPDNSPVQPEKFTGYHTGVDFETTPAEANIAIPVPALCDGKLLLKKYTTGYGGVVVQSCTLAGQAVTVIYGHVKLSSVTATVGQELKRGDIIGILGKGYSTETDGERKHLHLGIHKGTTINILGYVQKKSDLSAWLDPMKFFK
ncbi:MAG: M23 family metallopeptidase [Patescibacteria group bacterium]